MLPQQPGNASSARAQAGFSIVEVMVGLMVGILVTLSAWGSVMFYEANRRSSMGGNSALENGLATALTIQRDVKSAGLGFVFSGQSVCQKVNAYFAGATPVIRDGVDFAPVSLLDGGPGSDEISVAYARSILGGAPVKMISGMTNAIDPIKVNSTSNVGVGDMILVASSVPTQPCTLMQVTQATTAGFGTDLARAANIWNPGDPAGTFTNSPVYGANSSVIRTGPLTWVTYRVSAQRHLEVRDEFTGAVDTLAENIVFLKAQYGVSDGIAPQIEQWVAGTDAWAPPLDNPHIAALRAVRIVVVARAPHREKPTVANGPCDATPAPPQTWPGGPVVDLSGDPDWQCYKYKTLLLTIPLKNMIYGGDA
jgi:type IV pilus assembly protein PilW